MELFFRIAVTIGISIALGLSYVLFSYLRFKYFSNKYADYDRDFSNEENQFFRQSVTAIEGLYDSPPKFPKWYSWFLYTAFIPTMFLIWLIAFLAGVGLVWLAKTELKMKYPDALFLQSGEVGFSALFVLFAGMFIAGWALYFVSSFSKRLALFVTMNSDVHGFDKNSVQQGHIFRLEHDMRRSKLSFDEAFDPKTFIRDKIKLYTRLLGWLSLIVLLPGLIFAIFDLRQFTAVTSDGIFKRSSYVSRDIVQFDFNKIEIVKFRCHTHEDGVQHASYDLFLNEDNKLEIENIEKRLDSIFVLDKKLRYASVEIRPYIYSANDGEEKYRLEKTCLDALGAQSNSDRIESVFHVDEYLGKTP